MTRTFHGRFQRRCIFGPVALGGWADAEVRAAVLPVSFYAGRHYRVDDWHVRRAHVAMGGVATGRSRRDMRASTATAASTTTEISAGRRNRTRP